MRRFGLHSKLIDFIREDRLHKEVEKAYARYAHINQLMDEWEAAKPHVAAQMPWHEARETWKAAGRPQPPWYEVLAMFDDQRKTPLMAGAHIVNWPLRGAEAERHREASRRGAMTYRARKRLREEPSDLVE